MFPPPAPVSSAADDERCRARAAGLGGRSAGRVVGQGPPATGGIPTFISALLASTVLRQRARLTFVNTTPSGERRPGSLTVANLRRAVRDAARVFGAGRAADVVHLNVSAAPTAPLARALVLCAAARAGGAKTILHAHTGRLHLAARSRVYRWLLRRSRLVVDAFVVVSRIEADAVRRVGLEAVVIPNGIDASRFRTGPKDEPPLIAFVGTVCERKGLIDLLGALSLLRRDSPPFRVEIVGDASQEGPGVFDRIRSAYARAGLDDVTFRGALDRGRRRRRALTSGDLLSPVALGGTPALPARSDGVERDPGRHLGG